ncbi:hypothetical protein [Azohydromonas aeria]|uniref:hypothetical protein n=1 Tax=Azohydromonas aeria TaxID=2590212 RepID=UPI0018DFB2E5|nr:hypothetical protein [Azohydromonas aeria]
MPLHTQSSVEAYIAGREWLSARLASCPLHPAGGCSFARHGSYPRSTPAGLRVARWYCPQGHRTFSLLPDFLASRLPGLLASIEDVVARALSAKSMEAAASSLREFDVALPSALRWLRRRMRPVCAALEAVLPQGAAVIAGNAGRRDVLLALRRSLPEQVLGVLPPPLGILGTLRPISGQHDMGPDRVSTAPYGDVPDLARAASVLCRCNPFAPTPFPPCRTCCACGVATDA